MLARPGSDNSPNNRGELGRQTTAMARFLERGRQVTDPRERMLTLILRSAASLPAQALLSASDDIRAEGILPKIVLARLEPSSELERLATLVSEIYGGSQDSGAIRWARNTKLLDAHEQAVFGTTQCWTGDAMGRDPSRRNALSLFAEDAPDMVRLAELGFTALWRAAEPVSERRLLSAAARSRGLEDFLKDDQIEPGRAQPSSNLILSRH